MTISEQPTIDIRRLDSGDIHLAKELFLFFQIDDGVENPTFSSDEYIGELLSRDDFHVIVAVENELVIGGLTAYELTKYKRETAEMYLFELGVRESHRREGIATGLIEFLKTICVKKEITEIFVGAAAKNTAALNLYQNTGGQGEKVIEFTYKID